MLKFIEDIQVAFNRAIKWTSPYKGENPPLSAWAGDTVKLRGLENPASRLCIPATFPAGLDIDVMPGEIMRGIEAGLAASGIHIRDIKRINIAYSHKHPSRQAHNKAESVAYDLRRRLQAARPEISWPIASGIYEEKQLFRSGNQGSRYALTKSQSFAVDISLQEEPLPFLEEGNGEKEYFIIVDNYVEQGTTLANWYSFLAHNGAHIIAVADSNFRVAGSRYLAQLGASGAARGEGSYPDAPYDCGRLPDIGRAFVRLGIDSGAPVSAQKALACFDQALQPYGVSLFSMTNVECTRLIENLVTYRSLEDLFDDFEAPFEAASVLKETGDVTMNRNNHKVLSL